MKRDYREKVSVVVVCYNQEETISETVESIASQTGGYDLEILVCDDASADGTPDIIRGLAAAYPGVVVPVLREKNLGVTGNFYDGVSRASGEYVMVCGGDDYWIDGKIAEQAGYLRDHPETGMVYASASCIDGGGNPLPPYEGRADNSFVSFLGDYPVCAVTIAVRRDELLRYMREVNPASRGWLMEDFPLALWFSLNSRVDYIDKPLAVYRVLGNSLTHETNFRKRLRFDRSVADVKKYYVGQAGADAGLTRRMREMPVIEGAFSEWQLAYLDGDKAAVRRCRKAIAGRLRFLSLRNVLKFIILSYVPGRYLSRRTGGSK